MAKRKQKIWITVHATSKITFLFAFCNNVNILYWNELAERPSVDFMLDRLRYLQSSCFVFVSERIHSHRYQFEFDNSDLVLTNLECERHYLQGRKGKACNRNEVHSGYRNEQWCATMPLDLTDWLGTSMSDTGTRTPWWPCEESPGFWN